jgi:hypothetical protein
MNSHFRQLNRLPRKTGQVVFWGVGGKRSLHSGRELLARGGTALFTNRFHVDQKRCPTPGLRWHDELLVKAVIWSSN